MDDPSGRLLPKKQFCHDRKTLMIMTVKVVGCPEIVSRPDREKRIFHGVEVF